MEPTYWNKPGKRRTINSGGMGPLESTGTETGAKPKQAQPDRDSVSTIRDEDQDELQGAVGGQPVGEQPAGGQPVAPQHGGGLAGPGAEDNGTTSKDGFLKPPQIPPRSRSTSRNLSPASSRPPTPDPRADSRRNSLSEFDLVGSYSLDTPLGGGRETHSLDTPLGGAQGRKGEKKIGLPLLHENATEVELNRYLLDLNVEVDGYTEYQDLVEGWNETYHQVATSLNEKVESAWVVTQRGGFISKSTKINLLRGQINVAYSAMKMAAQKIATAEREADPESEAPSEAENDPTSVTDDQRGGQVSQRDQQQQQQARQGNASSNQRNGMQSNTFENRLVAIEQQIAMLARCVDKKADSKAVKEAQVSIANLQDKVQALNVESVYQSVYRELHIDTINNSIIENREGVNSVKNSIADIESCMKQLMKDSYTLKTELREIHNQFMLTSSIIETSFTGRPPPQQAARERGPQPEAHQSASNQAPTNRGLGPRAALDQLLGAAQSQAPATTTVTNSIHGRAIAPRVSGVSPIYTATGGVRVSSRQMVTIPGPPSQTRPSGPPERAPQSSTAVSPAPSEHNTARSTSQQEPTEPPPTTRTGTQAAGSPTQSAASSPQGQEQRQHDRVQWLRDEASDLKAKLTPELDSPLMTRSLILSLHKSKLISIENDRKELLRSLDRCIERFSANVLDDQTVTEVRKAASAAKT